MPSKIKQLNKEKQIIIEIDASGEVLGRLATRVAVILQGKDKPNYAPNRDVEPVEIHIKNIKKIKVTGKKFTDKKYYRHSGYLGHLYERTFEEQFLRNPASILEKAVYNMLPKNKLRAQRMKRLKIA
ncbi:MAG: 50S ribosomal protein L13 [Candidatus Spechtbacteria bacterium RIFCSPLOWO2_01_FULL_46_10]|uniref:Large ribosomal subunit protein uL13 n=1 Tax=Candidatus Spechtbacteria bacterium RIFCSPLOWO2_01_FULL_46_10 TaxID=1802163 RepID=A0A1G2HHM4_9BACT|nr:MAG: 50S ribosomal protein L13 [Candidatus Spechtbacteria bacterium RIFCSPLOWO2_01_FULL_46_10]